MTKRFPSLPSFFTFPALPIFRVKAVKAALEVIILQIILFVPLSLFYLSTPKRAERTLLSASGVFYLIFGLCSVFWFGLRWRLRPVKRPWWLQSVIEVALSVSIAIELLLVYYLCEIIFRSSYLLVLTDLIHVIAKDANAKNILTTKSDLILSFTALTYISAFFCGCLFFVLRVAIYILTIWSRLRKKHLRWALTHAHLMVVLWGAGGLYLLIVLLWIWQSLIHGRFFSEFNLQAISPIVVVGGALLFAALVGVAVVLPPSALFSYLFARHVTSRLEKLVAATNALRAGDYTMRLNVDGEDEIAHLQSNFNVMAEELEKTLSELKAERDNVATLLQARRELIASVSHELRTPVATVRGYLESTLTGWNEQPPVTLQQDLRVMEQQTIRLQSLINDLFTLARAEVGHLEMVCMPTNVEPLVQRVIDTMAPLAWRSSRVEVMADIEKVQPVFPRILVDSNRLEQIIQNLLHNAIRHTPPGGIIIVSAYVKHKNIVLQVKDTGEGIAQEELEHIWDRFYRAQNVRHTPESGSGLGLTIVKELTETMGGSVQVTSTPGQGTCFTLSFPTLVVEHTDEVTPLAIQDQADKHLIAK